jgi:precorrin-3B methylase
VLHQCHRLQAAHLLDAIVGREAATPVAVVSHATLKTEQTVVGTLEDIAERVARADLPLPGMIVVGEVVANRTRSRVQSRVRREKPVSERGSKNMEGQTWTAGVKKAFIYILMPLLFCTSAVE